MEITLTATIPDEIAATLQNGSSAPLGRILLELASIQAYQADIITSREVQEMLGFESREELFEFFKRYDVRSKYTIEDLEKDRATLATLLEKQ
jgi:hypothetical protein